MKLSKETAVSHAKEDLASRLGLDVAKIELVSLNDQEFRDMSLGAAASGEMSAQMISYGWRILLDANGAEYEYRGDKFQLRLVDFKGSNHLVFPQQ
ncbi:MAG: hypothetical protein R2684_03060 [Pyrinomonadaceae bacterium]